MDPKKYQLTILFLLMFQLFMVGQDNYQVDLLSKNKIKAIEFYNYKIKDGKVTSDSIRTIKSEFNLKGYVTNTVIYDSLDIKNRYERIYQDDTTLILMNTYKGLNDSLIVAAKFANENGRRISETHYKNGEKIIDVKNHYNDKDLVSKRVVRYNKNKAFKTRFEYNLNNQLVKVKNNRKDWKKLYYDKYGRHISTFQIKKHKSEQEIHRVEYEGKTNNKTKVITKHYRSNSIIGEGGILKINKGDELIKEYYYLKNGLIDYVNQYLNGKLNAVKKYKYVL